MQAERPVAISMGDPAGIGPEIIVRALAAEPHRPAIVVGDAGILARAARLTGSALEVDRVDGPDEVSAQPGLLHTLAVTQLPGDLPFGRLGAVCGEAAHRYIVRAAGLAASGEAAALVTAPVNKQALQLAGVDHPGHTEILAELAGARRVAMMLANRELRVVLVSVHVALRDAIAQLDEQAECETIELAHEAGRRLGFDRPRIAVAGLNPHAGEHGMFGDEDLNVIAPAVRRCRALGIDASGPWPADTVFMRARNGEFDVVVGQYHDQGLIPIKYLGLEDGVNVTLGLPYVRTSVDHGTAFDIAGSGRASPDSLRAALRMADQLTRQAAPSERAHA